MTAFSDGAVLLRESVLHPEDVTLRMAYADWLDEEAMERGEPIPCARARFVRIGFHPGWIPDTPTPTQFEWLAWEGREETFASGYAGLGKTTALLMVALRYATHPKYQALIVGQDHVWDRLAGWLKDSAGWQSQNRRWIFPDGARIQMLRVGQWERALGMSVSFVGIDHAESVSELGLQHLRLRARARIEGIPDQVRLT